MSGAVCGPSAEERIEFYRQMIAELETELETNKAKLSDAIRDAWAEGVREIPGFDLTRTEPKRSVNLGAWLAYDRETYTEYADLEAKKAEEKFRKEMAAFEPSGTLKSVESFLKGKANGGAIMDHIIEQDEGEVRWGLKMNHKGASE